MKKALLYSHRAEVLASLFLSATETWDIDYLAPPSCLFNHVKQKYFDFLIIELTSHNSYIPTILQTLQKETNKPVFLITEDCSWCFFKFTKQINIAGIFTFPFDPKMVVFKIDQFFRANFIQPTENIVVQHPELIGTSKKMHELREIICKCGQSNNPVYIFGESGSGKELVARSLHNCSAFKNGPYEVFNVSCIPYSIAESTLFGSVVGAFTDARNAIGLFESANMGSLFLDEITSLDLTLQPKLLRVLETGEVQRVGDNTIRQTNFRLICASNIKIEDAVLANCFREDLMYRIDVLRITVPPLREHPEDIPLLIASKLKGKKIISQSALEKLQEYSWPGNVRQLFQCLARAEVFSSKDIIQPEHIQF